MESIFLEMLKNDGRLSTVILCGIIIHLYKRSFDCEKKHEASELKYDELLRKLAIKGCIQRDCPKNSGDRNGRNPPSAGGASPSPVLMRNER